MSNIPEYTPAQRAFIQMVQAKTLPLMNHYFAIPHTGFDLKEDGEFKDIDTHVAFLIFEAGFDAATKAEVEPMVTTVEQMGIDLKKADQAGNQEAPKPAIALSDEEQTEILKEHVALRGVGGNPKEQ